MQKPLNISLLFILFAILPLHAIDLIPYPFEYSTKALEYYEFNDTTAIICRQKSLVPVAEIFANTVRRSTGLEIPFVKKSTHPIYLEIDKFIQHPEFYYLIVTKSSIEVYGGTPAAVYYGLQTLLQFLPNQIESPTLVKGVDWSVPALVIQDFPKYPYRGLHIDPCRHFMPIPFLKKQIDWMSKFKFNHLHMHFTDDQAWTIEIKHYPQLTKIGSKRVNADGSKYYGGYYTQSQLRDLVEYASLRGVTIIPEIEMPGHAMAALAAYPHLGCTGGPYDVRSVWGIEKNIFCAGNDSVYKFMEDVLTEVASIFPSKYIHVGGDECPASAWHNCPKCQNKMRRNKLRSEEKLYGYFMKRIEKILNRLDRQMFGWDEAIKAGLSTNAAFMSWHDENIAVKAAHKGNLVVMTPWNLCYLDHYQGSKLYEPMAQGGHTTVDDIYEWSILPDRVRNSSKPNIIGGQGNLWTEYIYTPEHAEMMMYPRLLALSETLWTHCEAKDSFSFHSRLDSIYSRLDYGEINYHIPLPEGPQAQYIEFLDTIPVYLTNTLKYPMYFSLDTSDWYRKYSTTFTIDRSHVINVFTVAPSGSHSDTIHITYKKLESARSAYKQDAVNGLYRQRAYGYFPNARGIDTVKFAAPQLVDSIVFDKKSTYKRPWIEVYNGYFNVDSTDSYVLTADVEELWVDGVCIVDNNDLVKRGNCKRGIMYLEKGLHSFRLIYNNCVNEGFPAIWRKPFINVRSVKDKKFRVIPKGDFYR